jgi:hypothetical protein
VLAIQYNKQETAATGEPAPFHQTAIQAVDQTQTYVKRSHCCCCCHISRRRHSTGKKARMLLFFQLVATAQLLLGKPQK